MANLTGNKNGMILWNVMANSDDKDEQDYFVRINKAAVKAGVAWFTDMITQREEQRNQALWQITWDAGKTEWRISKFHVPEDAKEITDRMAIREIIRRK